MIDYSRSAYAKKDTQEENWWQRRSGLERKLIILFTLAVVFSGGCVLFIILRHSPAQEICNSPPCLSAASELASHMDPEADPCEDFFQFVCGKFSDDMHTSLKDAYERQLTDKAHSQLLEIMEEPIDDDDHYLISNQKDLFQACLNETGAEDSMDIFQETLDELGGWPVVRNFAWKARLFDWIDTMYVFRKRGYPYSMMLNVGVMFSVDEPQENMVVITDPFLETVDDEHKHAYTNYMIDVAVTFGADRHRAEIEMPEALEFLEKMTKIRELNWANSTEAQLSEKVTVKEFQERHDQVEWVEFINNILYPITSITSDQYVVFPSDDYIKAFLSLINTTSKRVQANYMIWSVLNRVIPYMSDELKQLKTNYDCLTEKQSSTQDRTDFCKDVLEKRFFKILYARKYLPAEKREQAEELFLNIKSEFMTVLTETLWMDEESSAKALEKAEEVVEIIGAPGDYFNDTVFDDFEYADDFEGSGNNASFFNMFLALHKRKADVIYTYLDISINGTFFHGWSTNTRVRYLRKTNTIIVPAGFLQENFYSDDRPMYLNYAAAGTEIAYEIAEGFCEDDDDMWSNDTATALKEHKECISKEVEELGLEDTESGDNHGLTVEESLADYTGIKVAYRAYKNWANANGEEAQLAGVEYSSYQLFWISAMSLKCFKMSEEESLQSNSSTYRVFQANGPFRNNPEFANDFKCPLDSGMNPSEKCEAF